MQRLVSGLVILILVGCSGDLPTQTLAEATSASPLQSLAPVGEPPPLRLELVATELQLPSSIVGVPDGTLYVTETHSGLVRVIETDGSLRSQPFLDLADRIRTEAERGLLGLAVHPDYEANGRLFVHYSRASDGAIVVSEFARAADGSSADPSSERTLLTVEHPLAYHNGGQLDFGPDGYLYVALGDGGDATVDNGQNPRTLLGKILRIDVDGEPAAGKSYAIPPDNPFVGGDGAAEVFLFGLRNPWRFSFDEAADALWVADVGAGAYDEVNRLDLDSAAGANLGWNVMEGNHCLDGVPCNPGGFVAPLTEYSRDLGCAVIGGYVYRGETIPSLTGWYLFADYCSGNVFGVPSDAQPAAGQVAEPSVLIATELQVSTLGRGADGELYVADFFEGAIYRIVEDGGG